MKKVLSIILTAAVLLSVVSLAGCGKEELNFGLGIVSYMENTKSAEDDKNGQTELTSTAAAVLLDKDGKIVNCIIDSLDATIAFNSKGEFQKIANFATKNELGKDYGMVAYGGAKKEWFEQADAFETLVEGKTLQDVKALAAADGKGNTDVVNAGCTIIVTDFVKAVEKAVNNAKTSAASKDDSIKLGFAATQTGTNATEDKAGSNEVETAISAVTVDKDGKVTAAVTDAYQANVPFDAKGVTTLKATTDISTKLELGSDYGMVAYGGSKLEWYQQAAEFDKLLIGKNSDEIVKLATSEGKGNADLVNAGCTVNVSDMIKAASKAAK